MSGLRSRHPKPSRTRRMFRHWRTASLLGFLDMTMGPLARVVFGPWRAAAEAELHERARIASVAREMAETWRIN